MGVDVNGWGVMTRNDIRRGRPDWGAEGGRAAEVWPSGGDGRSTAETRSAAICGIIWESRHWAQMVLPNNLLVRAYLCEQAGGADCRVR